MAKHSATEKALEKLHAQLAAVFTKTLKAYEARLVVAELSSDTEIDEELIDKLLNLVEPNPAMLNAISKFLKDNDIMYTAEEVDELSSQQRRLDMLAKKRGASVSLSDLPLTEH